jgi:diguanylate cyclase (GGDEF)-like protein/PAS domain S-box-containing protein
MIGLQSPGRRVDTERRTSLLDKIGLVIIGTGASILYYTFERIISTADSLSVAIPVGAILIISVFTQYLLNSINQSQQALRRANASLENKVRERTTELRESENHYRAIFENTGTATVIATAGETISQANSTFLDFSATPRQKIENRKSWLDFLDDSSRLRITAEMSEIRQGEPEISDAPQVHEATFVNADGDRRDVLIFSAHIAGSERKVISFADVTRLKEVEKQIYHQAFHDALTGLPNRALFMEHLRMAMKRSRRRAGYHFAVLYMDIDRFKVINESLGHHIGDQLLQAFAARLRNTLRDIDNLARFGGDEFVILLEDIESSEFATKVARRLQRELRPPFILAGNEIYAPASCGIVFDTGKYEHPGEIIRDADTAMYHAKEKGRAQFQVFDPRLHAKIRELHQLETDLRKSINRQEFELHYQPIVSMDSGAVIGVEALVRWNHPTRGMIAPDTFIPIAEETGLIIPIGRWVLKEACCDLMRWQKRIRNRPPLFMSVNISSKQFLRPNLLEEIEQILSENGLPPEQLKLEITETALMENKEVTLPLIEQLKKSGIKIVIDDFGTGYSSMSYLQQLPIDTLKVDRSFISKMSRTADENKKIVETIIALAHQLNMNVVAEGVETREQHSVLSGMKCQHAQGFLFSRPLHKEKMEELIGNMDRFACLNPHLHYKNPSNDAPPESDPAQKTAVFSSGLRSRFE